MDSFKVWECQICNWIYDEAQGCPEEGLAPGTRWQDIPDDWCCPECGVGKDDFEMVDITSPVAVEITGGAESASTRNEDDEPIVIIGSGLSAYCLVKELRQHNQSVPIVIYTADDGAYYSKPQLSTGFSTGKTSTDMIIESAENMAKRFNLEINVFSGVTDVDCQSQNVVLENGGQRRYSKLVLATGSKVIDHSLTGDGIAKVLSVNSLSDYARFRTLLKPEQTILVIGAGLIGCEYTDDFVRSGYKVHVVDPQPGVLAGLLPESASKALSDSLEKSGAVFHFNTVVRCVKQRSNRLQVNLENGEQIDVDLVLSAIGVRPDLTLAKLMGLNCRTGIVVDTNLQTSVKNIYALGDCAEVYGKVLPYVAPLNAQGKALAKTLLGELTEVQYGVMPISVKTRLHPVNLVPPLHQQGAWLIDEDGDGGVKARFVDENGRLHGYVLTAEQCAHGNLMSSLVVREDGTVCPK